MFSNKTFGIIIFTALFTSALIYFSSFFSVSNAASTTLSFTIVAATGNINTGNNNTGAVNTGNNNTGVVNTGNNNTGAVNTGNTNTGAINIGNTNTGNTNTGNNIDFKGIIIPPKEKPKDSLTGNNTETGNNVKTDNNNVDLNTNLEEQSHASSSDINQEKQILVKEENKKETRVYNNKKNDKDYSVGGILDNGFSCDISQMGNDTQIYKRIVNDDETQTITEKLNYGTTIAGSGNEIKYMFISMKSIGRIMTGDKSIKEEPICYTGEYLEKTKINKKSKGFNYITTGSGNLIITIIKLIINYLN